MTTVTRALSELSTSLMTATENEWISEAQAGKVFRSSLEELGNYIEEPVELGFEAVSESYVDPILKKAYEKYGT